MPKVSIITICKNEKESIAKTIESVLNQTYKDFEYIVIDGVSDDGTLQIIEQYKSRLSQFVSEPDTGIYNAQNKGIRLARGEYLLFLNAGDYLFDSNVLQDFFTENYIESILYGDMKILDKGKIIDGYSPPTLDLYFMLKSTLWHPVSFIKKELFLKYSEYDESFKIVSDYEFFLRVICVHSVTTKHISRFVTCFNTDGIGSSVKFQDLHFQERERAQLKNFPKSVLKLFSDYRYINESGLRVRFVFLYHEIVIKIKNIFGIFL